MSAWRKPFVGLFCGVALGCAAVALGAETRAVIASGIGGNTDYNSAFQRDAKRISKQLRKVANDVTLVTGDSADAQAVQTALDGLVDRARADDVLIFVYIGHGSYNGEAFKFNVSGPDFTATDLADWLEPAKAEHQLVVVTSASSGAVQEVLAAEGRAVISATRSGEQRNATVFGTYFSAALEEGAADIDKDLRVTALEAFRYAEKGIDNYYTGDNRMITENPALGGPDPVMVLAQLETPFAVNSVSADLLRRRDALELDVAKLRENKADYATDDYLAELQRLLIELAVVDAELSESPGANP